MELKSTFEKGVMNKDLDERLVPNGYYTHAENIVTDSVGGSDIGVVKNILSNKIRTTLDLGVSAQTLGVFSDETEQKIYYFVKSARDMGSQLPTFFTQTFLIEYDHKSKTSTILLHDNRTNKVFNIDESHRISSIVKIYNDDPDKNLLIWTDGNMEICCLNIKRAKSYSTNGFEKEDIYLIKKPPVFAPKTRLVYSNIQANEIEDKFISFAYRFKYLDGEYSALSPFSYYNFSPKPFFVDFESLYNKGMENNYNAVNVSFETGGPSVTDIQVVAKFSNSETLYVVETFNKKTYELSDNVTHSLTYNNKKLYTVLPEKEIYRLYDNVPRKAETLTLIGNRVVLGNYTEGYDMLDRNNKRIKLDYEVDVVSEEVNEEKHFNTSISVTTGLRTRFTVSSYYNMQQPHYGNDLIIGTPVDIAPGVDFGDVVLNPESVVLNPNVITQESVIVFTLQIYNHEEEVVFNEVYSFYVYENVNLSDLPNNELFNEFIEVINNDIKTKINYDDVLEQGDIESYPYIELATNSNGIDFILNNLKYVPSESNPYTHRLYIIGEETEFIVRPNGMPNSLKSFMDYEVGIVYQDEFKRSSTVQTTVNNTCFIPLEKSTYKNRFRLSVNNKAPYWAKNYRFAIKSKPLAYDIIYANRFYVEDGYTWVKLEGDNKDKVKTDDVLLVKKTADGEVTKPIKVKVLEVTEQERDFIKSNKDSTGFDIIEQAGLYMKIKPTDFSMGDNDFKVYQSNDSARRSGSGNYPVVTVDLFSRQEEDEVTRLFIPEGAVITLFIDSGNKPDSGDKTSILNRTYYVDQDYESVGVWFEENITNLDVLFANEGTDPNDYAGNLEVIRGYMTGSPPFQNFVPDPNGKEYLKVKGTKSGMSGGRYGRVNVTINVRTSDGYFVFETLPRKEVDLDIYYLSSEVFDIENGRHKGNVANQTDDSPAVCELDYFNCYCFGNGVESYKIRDGFNENYLNVDYSPMTTTIEEFKEITRQSDITWGSVYNESTNINGLNEFNTATINWKELDKQYGGIRVLKAREGNLLVIQEDKWGQVLYGKNAIYSADGDMTVTTTDDLLRDYIPYAGEYGITDPESFVKVAHRCYGVDKKRGVVLRLSQDGLSEITSGMKHWFKTEFQDRLKANVIGGFDPYYGTYNICFGSQPRSVLRISNRQRISRIGLAEQLDYIVNLTSAVDGNVEVSYNITDGVADLNVGGNVFAGLSGEGNVLVPVNRLDESLSVTVNPVVGTPRIELMNLLPEGNPLRIYSIVLNNDNEQGLVFGKGIKVNNGIAYRNDVVLSNSGLSEFLTEQGTEGEGKFPVNGDEFSVILYNDDVTTRQIDFSQGNRVRYLITDEPVTTETIQTLNEQAIDLEFTQDMQTNRLVGSLLFNRNNTNENLVLIYDLRPAIENDLSVIIIEEPEVVIPYSDIFSENSIVQSLIISDQPTNAILTVENFNSIKVVYSGANPDNDEINFNYQVKINNVIYDKQMTIKVQING